MYSNEQKKEIVETGLNEFAINPKFRDFLLWFISETDKVYEEKIKKKCKECNTVMIRKIKKGKPTPIN